MDEWLGCEEIVRQREKEQHAAALAKCSSGASMDSSCQRMTHHDSTVSNEVERATNTNHLLSVEPEPTKKLRKQNDAQQKRSILVVSEPVGVEEYATDCLLMMTH